MAKIIVVRHAESVANAEGIYQGQTFDTGLSPLGKKQARALAVKLSLFRINRVFASPLKRTKETAEVIAKKLGKKVETSAEIIETNHGVWEGKDKKWIKQNYSDLMNLWMSSPSQTTFPEGEKFNETVDRVKKFFFSHSWKGVSLVVTHDNVIRILICLACGIPIDAMWNAYLEPAAISIFRVTGINGTKKFEIIVLNETSHLKNLHANITKHAL
ncbi:hypothetical protein A2962_01110 [Candidatus Woesebacteria bacterium RIFCSPLOWO2_01_FULL_39_61]|uniref:Phosphoglycerate mutase n=1 Tax=Candidatus Woesebacteria bacterium RIFCSPHIGHO2_02_FULL_39_13 TaxID=1802505 RepID=A0A1F7Z0A7_9BACT|nr:MAG: hypothetical protein A2692_01985 [Candidatus Woesebacteria bacterium RIFCSPHIGHO2_01_FULL_39_95]OGM32378.1 MAG: hypothetical protein A3D01_04305 [Candidatus Woesebacteria bacterium RIFCSPHIGHO2_02_FULL_39_13]OGM37565.1 MAG: hypothetical protein A3E13_05155 [Candidatus Woesebacteria bacterium RIFCSPHIGHO2_12_FULL_40_20]OGM65634.1 MAG: hypothetical protein A2962_01110 [Candidatus Woesebacteria bacterium RIFCSPLOWO2_01_FULL_39_61]OGM73917.1 MAG: hypothetical protein A3H19_06310 [Candidatus